ncbi:MAG: nitroreductase family protein [Halanaerobiales bacterium]|nr:nitroreductase family protein [Halanaerobiales bacterium]
MKLVDIIKERRSIRTYQDKDVSKEDIKSLLKAAMLAPSAGNEQPWHFVIIDEESIINEIPNIHPYSKMITQVKKAILVCADLNHTKYEGFWIQDCAAATENILLKAVDLGLATVWLGIYPDENRVAKFKNLFNLPADIIPFSLIPVGYPADKKKTPNRFKENRIHRNKWK